MSSSCRERLVQKAKRDAEPFGQKEPWVPSLDIVDWKEACFVPSVRAGGDEPRRRLALLHTFWEALCARRNEEGTKREFRMSLRFFKRVFTFSFAVRRFVYMSIYTLYTVARDVFVWRSERPQANAAFSLCPWNFEGCTSIEEVLKCALTG